MPLYYLRNKINESLQKKRKHIEVHFFHYIESFLNYTNLAMLAIKAYKVKTKMNSAKKKVTSSKEPQV